MLIFHSVPRVTSKLGTQNVWPILFMCANQGDAASIADLQSLAHKLKPHPVANQRAALQAVADNCPPGHILNRQKRSWAVAKGVNNEARVVWTSWCVAIHFRGSFLTSP